MTLFFITGSASKFAEAKAILPELKQLNIELDELQELDAHKIIAAKLACAPREKDAAYIVEDTSLYIDGMGGLPGPLIKWFLKSVGPEGIYKIAQTFGAAATAKTIIGYANEQGKVEFFEGEARGAIVEPRETKFGWDGIFIPEGSQKTYAEMTQEEKNARSQRGKAFQKLKDYLEKYYGD